MTMILKSVPKPIPESEVYEVVHVAYVLSTVDGKNAEIIPNHPGG